MGPSAPAELGHLEGAMREADEFCGEWDLELPAEIFGDLLQAQPARSEAVAAPQEEFGGMTEEAALRELERAAEEIYDSDDAFDMGELGSFTAPMDWAHHPSQHVQAAQPPQPPQPQQPHVAHGLPTPAASAAGGGALPAGQSAAAAILPLLQSRAATDAAKAAPGYVAPHVQYLLNRAAAQAAAGVLAAPTPAVPIHGVMHPVLVGAEEMNTLYSKISSANAAQNEQRRNNRLARNRASARLRRKKKKTVVETLEAAATTLEQQLQCLREHDYSASLTDDVMNALEVDTAGELDVRQVAWDSRMDLLQQLFDDLRVHSNLLADVLSAAEATERGREVAELQELLSVLNLRPEQAEQLKSLGLREAKERAQHMEAELEQLREIRLDESQVQTFTAELKGFFSANQLSKLTTWLEMNKEVVEALDPLKERSDHDRRAPQEMVSFMFDFSDRNIRPTANATA